MSAMNKRPVSAYVQVGGMYFFARTLDKIRLHARGELHPDHHPFLGKAYDARVCGFLRVEYEALKARVLQGGTDEEIFAWCQQQGRALNELDLTVWNGFASKLGWRDDRTASLEKNKAGSGLAERKDLLTFFDYYEVDEGRAP